MISKLLIIVTFLASSLLNASCHNGHNHHHHGYGHNHGYGQHHNKMPTQVPNVNTVPPVNICPQIMCPQFIPPQCRKETYQNVYGIMCKGCDVNICIDQKVDLKPVDQVPKDVGPERGDIPKIPKFLNQINGQFPDTWSGSAINPTPPVYIPNPRVQSSNGVLWQNGVPVWQNNLPINGQLQNNIPPQLQWNDNALVNTQWQNAPQWQGSLPINNQWQNSVNLNPNLQNTVPVNSQLINTNPQVFFPVNSANALPQVSSGFNMPLISVTGNLMNEKIATGLWEKGPLQPVISNNLQNLPSIPNIASTPQDSSLPVFKNTQSIGSPINGLPMQITGKSIEATPVRVESDRDLGLTNSLYGALQPLSDLNSVNVYKANSPDVFNGI